MTRDIWAIYVISILYRVCGVKSSRIWSFKGGWEARGWCHIALFLTDNNGNTWRGRDTAIRSMWRHEWNCARVPEICEYIKRSKLYDCIYFFASSRASWTREDKCRWGLTVCQELKISISPVKLIDRFWTRSGQRTIWLEPFFGVKSIRIPSWRVQNRFKRLNELRD